MSQSLTKNLFSVGQSGVQATTSFIAGQEKHHARTTFQDELKALLKRYEIAF